MNLENTNSENEQSQSKIQKNKSKSKVDYDLTKMNYNLITSLLFDMAVEPEKYIGKSVRFSGEFFTDYNQMFKTRLFSCVIYDATLCCQAGIGFICNNLTYPKDFPKEKDTITIEGTFCLRDYDGISYSYLDCNEIISE